MTAAPIPTSNDALIYAHDYAARGLRVLPIRPGEKRPPMSAWQDAATTDPTVIDAWWTGLYRDHGVGIATGPDSGVFVLDVDVANGKAGDETLADLEHVHGPLPDTATVLTPSGGRHHYFTYPTGREIRNDAGRRLGPGLDIRGIGGQCVAPGDGRYHWDGGTPGDIADPPAWLIELLTATPKPDTPSGPVSTAGDNDSVAARYNARTTWAQLLTDDGWTLAQTMGDGEQRWVRPGKAAREGISATVGHDGRDALTVFTSSVSWLPEGTYSRFGYYACRDHAGDRSAAAAHLYALEAGPYDRWLESLPVDERVAPAGAAVEAVSPADRVELAHLVDWDRFWTADKGDEEWIAEPIIPAKRAVALYAPAKAGKSTIVLAVVAAVATGGRVLGHARARRCHVLYLDYEMTEDDLFARLSELGYGPGDDLSHLHYALLPSLPPLDTVEGARAVLDLVDRTSAELVVVDTFGRAVEGDEDKADTVRAFYRHTGLALKARDVAVLRTDHAGKDVGKGQRGSSAKADDVDLVWALSRTETGVRLKRTHSRISWVPEDVQVRRRETDECVDYVIDTDKVIFPTGTGDNAAILDQLGIDLDISVRKAATLVREAGHKMADHKVRDAVKFRQHRQAKELETRLAAGVDRGRRGAKTPAAPPSTTAAAAVAKNSAAAAAPPKTAGQSSAAVDSDFRRVSASHSAASSPYKGDALRDHPSAPVDNFPIDQLPDLDDIEF